MIRMNQKLRDVMDELKMNSSETYYHSVYVKNITVKMIRLMNAGGATHYNSAQTDIICKGALLHDVGKLRVKNVILTKESSLTPDEMHDIQEHTVYSFETVKDELDDDEYEIIKNICLYHHERTDGSGYEHKTDLPLYVQIVSICDVFSALYFDRVYRPGVPYNETMRIIEQGKSGYFDPTLIEYLRKATKEFSE